MERDHLIFKQTPFASGFVFYAPCTGAARRTGRASAWPFYAVRRSSELGQLGSLGPSNDDRQASPIQIVNNIRITAIPHHNTGAARRTARTGA